MAAKRVRSQDEAKHAAILEAAIRLFPKQGFTHTSMDAIALEARVTKQTVYAHYHNKNTLFTHMIMALSEKHAPPEALLKDTNKPVGDVLFEIGMRFLGMITSKEGLATTRLVITAAHEHPELARQYYENVPERMVSMLARFLKLQHKRGALAIHNADSAASYFYAMLKDRYYLRMLLAIKPLPDSKEKIRHVRETVQIFLKIYGGKKSLRTRNAL